MRSLRLFMKEISEFEGIEEIRHSSIRSSRSNKASNSSK